MNKNHITYLLSIFLLYFFISSYAQKQEIDSLYNEVKEINSIATFKNFEEFHKRYIVGDITQDTLKVGCLNVYKNALKWTKKQHDNKLFLKAKFYLLQCYKKQGDFKSFLNLANELVKNDDFKETKEIVQTLEMLMLYYRETEQFSELLDLYPLLYVYIKKHKVSTYRLEGGTKNREMGNLFFNLKDYAKSRFFFKKSISAYTKNKEYLDISSNQNNIGLTFLQQSNLDSAKFYFKKALNLLNTKTDITEPEIANFIPVLKGNIAVVWVKEKKFKKALPVFLEELKSTKKMKNNDLSLRGSYLNLAKFFFKKNDFSQSLKYLDSTKHILKYYPNNKVLIAYYDLKAKCLLVNGKISKANTIFEKLKTVTDSINLSKLKQQQILATIKYETNLKEKELLKKNQKIAFQKTINKYLKTGLIFLSVLLFLLFLFFLKIIKDKHTISLEKAKTQKSLDEKNILLKEVHHRVKNNLQIITSILDLENAKINDDKLNDILEQGQNRIQSMALVHQQLYEENNVKDVSIQKYLNSLINHIAISNNNPNVIFKIKTNNLRFNVNTAIPLGLIINELITNIFKHAFKDFEKGKVFIHIAKIKEHQFKMIIKDSGKGFPKSFTIDQSTSLGLKLVKILTNQLKGSLELDNNATFTIIFRDDVAV